MAYQMAVTAVTLKVIHRLQAFSNAIRQIFVQYFSRFQLTVCSHGSSALAELLVSQCQNVHEIGWSYYTCNKIQKSKMFDLHLICICRMANA